MPVTDSGKLKSGSGEGESMRVRVFIGGVAALALGQTRRIGTRNIWYATTLIIRRSGASHQQVLAVRALRERKKGTFSHCHIEHLRHEPALEFAISPREERKVARLETPDRTQRIASFNPFGAK